MELDKKFKKAQEIKQRSYGKLIQLQKRFFDEWALARLAEHGYPHFKMAYMPVLMNIGVDGITNNELADLICVTKQAVSKVIRELEGYGLVKTELHKDDARRAKIQLTRKGKEMVIKTVEEVGKRSAEYEKLVGKEQFKQALETMFMILDYERNLWEKRRKK